MNYKLIPRFHYTFRTIDLFCSFYSKKSKIDRIDKFFNYEKIYFLNSARSALKTFLVSISGNKSLKVGVQVFTCETVFKAIKLAGCEIVFIDIDNNFHLKQEDLERKLDQIDVLIVTHTFGFPFDLSNIRNVKKDLIIIEDCAHAFLSSYDEKPCGTIGDVGIFSFGYGKFPSIGNGGFILFNDTKYISSFELHYKMLLKPSLVSNFFHLFKNYVYSIAFKPIVYGIITYPFLKKVDKKIDFVDKSTFIEKQAFFVNINVFYNNFSRYQNILSKKTALAITAINDLKLQLPQDTHLNYYLIPILHNNRDIIVDKMLSLGFECGKHFHQSVNISTSYGYQKGSCPIAEEIVNTIFTIPIHSYMNENIVRTMLNELKKLI